MSDIESINSAQSKQFSEHNTEDYISRTNSLANSVLNPHSIFERTVEESLSNTPMLMHKAQRRLSRANSTVSISSSFAAGNNDANTQPIFINSSSRNNSNLYKTSSHTSVSRRASVISTHRHNENYIAPSLDSTCHLINDDNTTIDDIQIEDHPLSAGQVSSVPPESPIHNIYSPVSVSGNASASGNRTSPGTSPNAMLKGPLVRRPSTLGLDMALGVHRDQPGANSEQQSPPLRLNSFGFANANAGNSAASAAAGFNNSLIDSPLAQGNSPRLVRFQSYADILTEESSSLRRPSFGSANNSSISIKPQTSQSSQDMLEFQFGKQPSLLKKPSAVGNQYYGSSPLSSPLNSSKPSSNQHPLKNNVVYEGKKDMFERVTPQEYRKFDSNEKSPFHQLLNKE